MGENELGREPRTQRELPRSPQPVNTNRARARLRLTPHLPPRGDPPPPGGASAAQARAPPRPAPPSTGPQGPRPPPQPVPLPPRAAAVPLGRAEGGGVSRGPSPHPPRVWYLPRVGVLPGGGPRGRRAGAARSGGRVVRASCPGRSLTPSFPSSARPSLCAARGPARRRLLATTLCSADSGRGRSGGRARTLRVAPEIARPLARAGHAAGLWPPPRAPRDRA